MSTPYIIMPIKDSLEKAELAISAILRSGYNLTVYDDYSTTENSKTLARWSQKQGFGLIHLSELTDHPSPNYRTVLIHARAEALRRDCPLLIVESDVIVKENTFARMLEAEREDSGLVAAITVDETETVNYPYNEGRKHLSFCCTLLTSRLLQALDFEKELDPTKNWYDVTISHRSIAVGLTNTVLSDVTVTHYPHSSRPWKQLKYSNPLLYYWRKLTQRKDKI